MQNYILVVDGKLSMIGDRDEVETARVALPIDSKFDVIFGRFLPKTEARAANVRYPQRRSKTITAGKKGKKKLTRNAKPTVAHSHVAQ